MGRIWLTIRIVLALLTYFALAPFGYAAFAVLQWLPSRDRDARARFLQGVLSTAFGFMHAVLSGLRIIDFAPPPLAENLPDGPCVIVANHPSLVDVTALVATFRNLTSAVKPEIFRRFWARPLLTQAAYFEGPGQVGGGISTMMDSAVENLRRGFHVLVFPEGTRSPQEGLHPFGRLAFEIATRANVPVVPVIIDCQPRWLSKGQSLLRPPPEVPKLRLRAAAPVHPAEASSCSRTLRNLVESAILCGIAEGPNSPVSRSFPGTQQTAQRHTAKASETS